ncbi:MAG: UDP-N-acetylglucosamine--N-acetylmuramyl-(pentapeptide) pyrophosphoryl-undecaprenol N-acetylglucosamine transferase [Candidatus Magasanikbacteria bacterium]|nr:UDP-N-acetylglucosamine--N-acetylmuramyl-(pentapeptide) pyrophosphoryl-undecaprenol N-acetylglucosamine transferase [Candidatus Magasanikbacteria bacterium]
MRVIFSGGGTLGPVMPLIAIYQELKNKYPEWEFLWVGTKKGPEKNIAAKYDLPFEYISSAKLRRYNSWQNFFAVFLFLAGFIQSWKLIKKFRPDLLISAGGFVSVPLHWVAWLLKKTTIIHQQDIEIGLANKLMAKTTDFITTSFEHQKKNFSTDKTIWIGNPVRAGLLRGDKQAAMSHFDLDPNLLTVFVLGGGTGALSLNKLITNNLVEFIRHCQVIHMTGIGKELSIPLFRGHPDDKFLRERYHPVRFLDEDLLKNVFAAADLVISRAGLSALSELAVLGKPTVIVPIAKTHQVANAEYFSKRSGAMIFYEDSMGAVDFVKIINELLKDNHERLMIGHKMLKIIPRTALQKMCLMIEEIAKTKWKI